MNLLVSFMLAMDLFGGLRLAMNLLGNMIEASNESAWHDD